MGTEYPTRPNYPPRSAATPFAGPRNTTPFSSSGPVVGTDSSALASNPPPPPPRPFQLSTPPSSTATPVGSSGVPLRPSSYGPPTAGPFQRLPNTQMRPPSVTQAPPPPAPRAPFSGQPTPPPTMNPPSFASQGQPPSVQMGPPRPMMGSVRPDLNNPSIESSYSAPRPNFLSSSSPMLSPYPPTRDTTQPAFPGYPSNQPSIVAQGPPVMPSAFASQQGGYIPPPPAATAPFRGPQGGYFQTGTTPQGPAPPMTSVQGLAEDFNSLSLSSVPGSYDSRLDPNVLPRPLDGDIESKFPGQEYDVNCSSRFLRLTTNTIPSSQSLASRWHLPLGAVVCPLAEGEEVPVVNFGTSGIIRCRRCRTYVNPFVVFMDSGRKWKCNICSMMNDGKDNLFLLKFTHTI
ncbi:vesicle coat protein [Lithospermum erythrorhizon]|uniref:Vesicle coat protein n=1 Tax=Lithospermum erythrorhizon TaxID=34254 RepID=A0AAV3RA07_LITER